MPDRRWEDGPWEARLMVIELPDLVALTLDPDATGPDLEFPDPVVRDSILTTDFLRLHRAMEGPASALERQSMLATWLQDAAARSPDSQRSALRGVTRKHIAVRRACEYLRDRPTVNVTLDQLADATGTSKFQLVRLFRSAFGRTASRLPSKQRVAGARRLLERGAHPSEVAVQVGFFDESHLHRHFAPRLGMTPREIRRRVSAPLTPHGYWRPSTRDDTSPKTHGLVSAMKSAGKPWTNPVAASSRVTASAESVQSSAPRLSSN